MINQRTKRISLTLAKWLFSGGMLAYALHSIDVEQVIEMLLKQNPLMPLSVIALIIAQMAISTFRWQRLIFLLSGKTEKPTYAQLFNLNYIGVFFNSCLPGTIGGDVVRAMLLKSEKLPLTLCAHSVIIDRLLAVLAVFAMVVISLPWLGVLLPTLPISLLLYTSVAAVLLGLVFLAKAPKFLGKLPSTHLIRMTSGLIESIQHTVFAPRDFPILLLQAVLAHGCFCLCAILLAHGIGVELTLADSVVLIPPVLLLMMLPISIGGWGVREVSMVGMLALVNIPKEAALTISVQLGILIIIATLPGAWCYAKIKRH